MRAVSEACASEQMPDAPSDMEERPLRILLDMVGCIRAHWGGMQEHVHTLARHLAARGHEPFLLLRTDKTYALDTETRAVAARNGLRCISDPRFVSSAELEGPPAWRWMPALRDVLRRERIDVYHMHSPQMGNELWAAAAAYLAGYAPVMTYHTLLRPESRQRRLAMRFAHRHLHVHTIGVSQAVCDQVLQRYDPPRAWVTRVLNGIDEPRFPEPQPRGQDDGVTIGVLGRLNPDKGVDTLIAALGQVERTLPVRVVIVGDGPLEPELRRQALELGVAERIEFRGYVPDAGRLLPQFDVVAIPSRSEAFSLVAAEAYAAARPVVATQVGGLRELVRDGDTGWLVPPEDPAAMARAIEAAVRDPERRERMGAAGRRFFEERLHADIMAEGTLRVYRTVVRSRRSPV
jgi:glycosyltransferase involved in cell wall biosynthesis